LEKGGFMQKGNILQKTGWLVFISFFLLLKPVLPASTKTKPKVNITFWHAMEGSKGKTLQALVNKFNQTHPDIYVNAIFKGTKAPFANSYDDLIKALLLSLKEKKTPTISQVYENWTAQFMSVDAIQPIQKFVDSKDGYSPKVLQNDFVQPFLKSNEPNGKLLTLPFNKSLYVLYFNADLFKKEGLTPPASWDDFKKDAEHLTIKNNQGDIARYGFADPPNIDLFGLVFYSFGGSYFKEGKAAFNDIIGESALSFLRSMAEEKSYFPDYAALEDFATGKSAMYIDTTAAFSFLKHHASFQLGIAPIPGEVRTVSLFAGTNLAIYKQASPAQQKAAWIFIRWLLEPQNLAYWCAHTGYLPVRWSVLKTSTYQHFLAQNPQWKIPISQLQQAFTDPRVWAWEGVRGFVTQGVEEAITGKTSVKQALDEAANETNRLLSQ
jgi:multiple sugar transport system substrate-binding protein